MEIVVSTKVCRKCGAEKAIDEFRERKDRYKNRVYLYRDSKCRDCEREFSRNNTAKYNERFKDEIARKYKEKYRDDAGFRERIKAREKARYGKRREQLLAYRKTYRAANLARECARARRHYLKCKYGLTQEAYLEILEKQRGLCAICECESDERGFFAVDHCHDTGIVRGLLCFRCNSGLGHFGDDAELLASAIGYLLTHHAKEKH